MENQKSDQWKKDRETLRRSMGKTFKFATEATLRYCLVSHMRGKLHMKWYAKYHGGWRSWREKVPTIEETPPPEIYKAYAGSSIGVSADELAASAYARAAIRNLDDQAQFISKYMNASWVDEELKALVERVLAGYPIEAVENKAMAV